MGLKEGLFFYIALGILISVVVLGVFNYFGGVIQFGPDSLAYKGSIFKINIPTVAIGGDKIPAGVKSTASPATTSISKIATSATATKDKLPAVTTMQTVTTQNQLVQGGKCYVEVPCNRPQIR